MPTEITLQAALRDSTSPDDHFRAVAIRNLASAYLESAGQTGPLWQAAALSPHGDAVVAALHRAFDDPSAANRGLAAVGLGTLGDARVEAVVRPWLLAEQDDEATVFLRQCAVITCTLLAQAAPPEQVELRASIEQHLRTALRAPRADLRFQAAIALAEVSGRDAEDELLAALARENDPRVRTNLIDAVAQLGPLSPRAVAALVQALDEGDAGVRAAIALAGGRRAEGGPRLVAALGHPNHRDDALEALAVLGPRAPAEAAAIIERLSRSWRIPGVTKVRAVYALARITPDRGLPRLRRLGHHPRRAVREAVRDAWSALQHLEDVDGTG